MRLICKIFNLLVPKTEICIKYFFRQKFPKTAIVGPVLLYCFNEAWRSFWQGDIPKKNLHNLIFMAKYFKILFWTLNGISKVPTEICLGLEFEENLRLNQPWILSGLLDYQKHEIS